jgi:aspartyl protease family protein
VPTISTPCINVCVLDPLSALCVGCGRTGEEITAWATMSEPERIAVMARLEERLAEARSCGERRGDPFATIAELMRFILPVAALAVALAALFLTPHDSRLFGLGRHEFASAAIGVSLLLWLALSGWRSARPSDIARLATAAMTWALLFIAATGFYAYRFEASEIFARITGELLPSEPQVERGGEVVINRRYSGEFAIAGRVNNARVTFRFDTGASSVVLSAEDARRAGVETSRLVFDVPVATANGAAMAAETRLDQIAVGPIVMRNVPAMVARRGALDESLLGMSFLERLKSYTVERDRLILVAK